MLENSSNLQDFSERLLEWYDREKRDLPWRRSKDPYRIWVSEIMLQQTRVDTVIPYFERFMSRFPTMQSLAEAPEEEVLKAWEGLGYYSRARHLQSAVREVCELYGGEVPDDPRLVAGLRGVGPYTAGAILSIAFNRPEPAVDGNVMRVLSRFFLIEDDVARPASRAKFEALARKLIPEGRAGDFNQALMDFGATVCTPKNPGCLVCPVMELCAGRLAGREKELPVKAKAKKARTEYRAVALIEGTGDNRGKVLICQRPSKGLLAGMWELPHVLLAGESFDGAEAALSGRMMYGQRVVPYEALLDIEHVFSHIRWVMRVYLTRLADGSAASAGFAGAEGAFAGKAGVAAVDLSRDVSAVKTEGATAVILGGSAGQEDACRPEADDAEGADRLAADGTETRWIGPQDRAAFPFPNVFIRILDAYWNGRDTGKEPM